MNYNEAIQYVHSLMRFGIKPGLERVSALLARLGNPQDKVKTIHVAGTNGKGSICYMSAAVLKKAGYKVGLYTSPYVVRFNERIQIDFCHISNEDFAKYAAITKSAAEDAGIETTEFEFITAAAFLYFADMGCDYVVTEVGLGGRLDATNVIKAPEVSVIASISFDHTGILGDTLAKIAAEKGGIIKQNCKTVLYPVQDESVTDVIKNICKEKNNILTIPDTSALVPVSEKAGALEYQYGNLAVKSRMWGSYQMYNGITVIEAMRQVGIPDGIILNGIAKASVPGRLEMLSGNILLDVGHNPAGIDATVNAIKSYAKVIAVMGMCEDKNYAYCIEKIASIADTFIGVTADTPRALSAENVAKSAAPFCKNIMFENDIAAGIDRALKLIDKDSLLLVCGSFYVITPARAYLLEIL